MEKIQTELGKYTIFCVPCSFCSCAEESMADGSRPKCPKCVRPYDEIIYTPMLLKCNHCFCKPCITRFIQTNGLCAICQYPIMESFREIPLYQMGINDIRTCKEKENIRKGSLEKINFLSKLIEYILDVISPLTTTVMILQVNISKLKEILRNETPSEEMKMILNQIGNDSKETVNILRNKKFSCELTFTLQREVFQKLHYCIQSGQTMYIFHQINDEIKYGRVSIWENMILFHCLDLSEVKISSGLIQLDYLKRHLCFTRILPFIILTLREGVTSLVFFRMFIDQRDQMNLFINLCTGEKGISYKSFWQLRVVHVAHGSSNQNLFNRILVVETPGNEIIRIDDVSNYCYNGFQLHEITESETIFVELLSGYGSFALNRTSKPNCIGKVIFPPKLSEICNHADVPEVKIVDCGIAVAVQF